MLLTRHKGPSWDRAVWVYPGYERAAARDAWLRTTLVVLPSHEAVREHMETSLLHPFTGVWNARCVVHAGHARGDGDACTRTVSILLLVRHALLDGRGAVVVLSELQAALLRALQPELEPGPGAGGAHAWGQELGRLPISVDAATHDALGAFSPAQVAEGERAMEAMFAQMAGATDGGSERGRGLGTTAGGLPVSARRQLAERNVRIRRVLSQQATTRVVQAGRAAGASVTSLVLACALAAMHAPSAPAAHRHYALASVVDRRRYLRAGASDAPVSMGVVGHPLAVTGQTSVVALARALHAQQSATLDAARPLFAWGVGVPNRMHCDGLHPPSPTPPPATSLFVSSLGPLDLSPSATAASAGALKLTPVDLEINIRMSTGLHLLHLWTFRGRLHMQSASAWHEPSVVDAWLTTTIALIERTTAAVLDQDLRPRL